MTLKAELEIRDAGLNDLPDLLELLQDDDLGKRRETLAPDQRARYESAFAAIENDPNNRLIVMRLNAQIIGMAQLTYIPGLSHGGSLRGQIESVRIARNFRGQGFGTVLMEWAIQHCREKGCSLVQLTSDIKRDKAHRFYQNLGFKNSHSGFKLFL